MGSWIPTPHILVAFPARFGCLSPLVIPRIDEIVFDRGGARCGRQSIPRQYLFYRPEEPPLPGPGRRRPLLIRPEPDCSRRVPRTRRRERPRDDASSRQAAPCIRQRFARIDRRCAARFSKAVPNLFLSMGHSAAEIRVFAERWAGAWNARDLGRIMEHYAAEVEFEANTVVRRWGKAFSPRSGAYAGFAL